MDEKQNKMPDFDSLDDRVIAENSVSPRIVAKTKLDVKSSKENNPYSIDKNMNDRLFNEFFEDE